MKNRLLVLTALCSILWISPAQASYYAHCNASILVKKKHPPQTGPSIGKNVKITFSIIKIISSGGHSRNACSKFLKRELTRSFILPKGFHPKIKKNSTLIAKYFEWNGRGAKGIVSGRSWRLLPPKKKR